MVIKRVNLKEVRNLLSHHNPNTRKYGVQVASVRSDRKRIELLKAAVFDLHSSVRAAAVDSLAKNIGLRATAEFILARYPGSALSNVPAEFFIHPAQAQKVRSLRNKGGLTMAEQGKQGSEKIGFYAGPFGQGGVKIKQLPIGFKHRGFTVRFEPSDGGGNIDGHIMIGSKLSKKTQKAYAEHEYGENFCAPLVPGAPFREHNIALALEFLWVKKNYGVKRYLRENQLRIPEFMHLTEKYPGEFKELEKLFNNYSKLVYGIDAKKVK